MNYYPFHIGDYIAHTAHLTPIEDIAYRRLLDLYYQTEGALTGDLKGICRLIRMREHEQEVADVLGEFFTIDGDRWTNERCDSELQRMTEKQTKAKASAEASWSARKAKAKGAKTTESESSNANAMQTHSECNANALLPTPTPTPINTSSLRSDGACDEALAAKAMRAVGLHTANPSDPRLAKLLSEGVTIDELTYVAAEAVRLGKPFAYALAMAAGRREDAAKLQVGKPPGRRTPTPENFENKNYGQGVELV